MSVLAYLRHQEQQLRKHITLLEFRELIQPLHELYLAAMGLRGARGTSLIPKDAQPNFGRLFLLCHKAFLSSVGLALRGAVADVAPITRRVIEAAELAALIHHDVRNAEIWLSYEQRMKRYEERMQGRRPATFKPKYSRPKGDTLLEQLGVQKGLLSDGGSHVTPEFVSLQKWGAEQETGDTVRVDLEYLSSDERSIARELVNISAVHWRCLLVFDRVYAGAFRRDRDWDEAERQLQVHGERYTQALQREIDEAEE